MLSLRNFAFLIMFFTAILLLLCGSGCTQFRDLPAKADPLTKLNERQYQTFYEDLMTRTNNGTEIFWWDNYFAACGEYYDHDTSQDVEDRLRDEIRAYIESIKNEMFEEHHVLYYEEESHRFYHDGTIDGCVFAKYAFGKIRRLE